MTLSTSFQRAKKAGFENINLDIMFGYPGADDEDVEGYRQAVCLSQAGAYFAVQSADRRGHGDVRSCTRTASMEACSGDNRTERCIIRRWHDERSGI